MTSPAQGFCVDCGQPSMGTRCRKDYGRWEQQEFARVLAGQDAEILQMRDIEKLSVRRIADRMGISTTSVYRRLAGARRREKIRQPVAS